MDAVRDFLRRLPVDETVLRRVPVPGLHGDCILELDLRRGVVETPPASPFAALRQRHTPVLRALLDGLRRGADDGRVVGLLAHASAPLAFTHVAELRSAVAAFAQSGKPTLAWAETFGELVGGTSAYLFAAAFGEVWLQPTGDLALSGAVAEALFLRGALDKLDIEPQFGQRHEFKTAADGFLRESMSPAHREMVEAIVASVNDTIVRDVARDRRLEEGAVADALAAGLLRGKDAHARGLVDRLGYRDEARAALRAAIDAADRGEPASRGSARESAARPEESGRGRGARADLRYVERYRSTLPGIDAVTKRGRPVVAIVHAEGPIHLGRSGTQGSPFASTSIGADTLSAALREAGRDKHVRAVVLRIDSPGGSYVASDAIRREVLALRERGTVVVASMGTVAGSGGYYIAMPCERIVAGAATLTGSIGVLAGKHVLERALGRIGLRRESVAAHPGDEMFSTRRPFTDAEWTRLNDYLDEVYADFVAKAAADRGMSEAALEPHARGRVWTGADAATRGLVDEIGGLEEAIAAACARIEVPRDRVEVRVVPKIGPFDRFLPAENSDSPVAARLGEGLPLLDRAWTALGLTGTGVLTMPPFRLA